MSFLKIRKSDLHITVQNFIDYCKHHYREGITGKMYIKAEFLMFYFPWFCTSNLERLTTFNFRTIFISRIDEVLSNTWVYPSCKDILLKSSKLE